MTRRSEDWNVGLARDPFAREFLLAAAEEGVPIQAALKVIRAMGVEAFAGGGCD